jgi:hypothetical protein
MKKITTLYQNAAVSVALYRRFLEQKKQPRKNEINHRGHRGHGDGNGKDQVAGFRKLLRGDSAWS